MNGQDAMSIDFLIATLIVVISPGIGMLFTLAIGLSRGSRASTVAAFSCTLGIVPHMLAAIFGLAALLHTSALAFQMLKYAGVAWLLYMAWKTLRERGPLHVNGDRRMLELSGVFMALTFVVFVGNGLFASAIRRHVISRPQVLSWMRRTFAAAFVALGARLAFAER